MRDEAQTAIEITSPEGDADHPVIELHAVLDDDLVTITGGREYGWRGSGGWISRPGTGSFSSLGK